MTEYLQVRNLRVWIGKREVIKDISFACQTGVTGLLGKNGAGKTTLMKALLQLGYRQSGQVSLGMMKNPDDVGAASDNVILSDLSSRERACYLAYVPQELHPSVHCTVLDFVVMGRNPYLKWMQQPNAADYRAAKEALNLLQIAHLKDCYMDRLSGGERKAAYLARARVQQAKWMLLDEPTAGLDFGRQHHFLELLSDYVKKERSGAIVSIHDPLLAYTYCDQILVLQDGGLAANLQKKDPDFEKAYSGQIEQLYGKEAFFVDTPVGKSIVWRKKTIC
ncbi:MAG: ABC transporter ATP-binding protein [Lachnospiraceae bacterium]